MRRYSFSRGLAVLTSIPSATVGDAGGEQLIRAFDFHQAHPAPAVCRKAGDVAKLGDVDSVLARDLEDGLIVAGADIATVDLQSDNARHGYFPFSRG